MISPHKDLVHPKTLLSLLILPAAVATHASEYTLDYSVEAQYGYIDNVRLSPENEIDVSGGKLILPVTLTRRTERLETSLTGEVSSYKFDEQRYNSDDQNLQTRATYQLERGQLEGYGGYKRDSTLDSEFTDTGEVGLSATRKEIASVGGTGYHMITEKNGLSGGVDYVNVEYQSPNNQDYDFVSGYAGWLHQWSERTQLSLQGYANRYENDAQVKVKSDGLGVQAGFDSELSEQLSLSLLLGWVSTDTSYSSGDPIALDDESDGTFLGNGSLKYRQERYQLEAKFRSGTTPSGNGYQRKTDQLDLLYRYQLTERSRFNLALIAGQSSALDSNIDNDRDYTRVRLRLDYRFSRQWYVAGTYTYSYQDRERDFDDADSNAVYLSLIFQPEKNVWSR